jgi:signal transduction histidine kinase
MVMTVVFFIYGLAFFSMGLAVLFESRRAPILAERRILIPLAAFGLVHGVHEWLEMFLDNSGWMLFANHVLWGWLRLGILIVSFISLLVFGLQLLFPLSAFTGVRRTQWILSLAGYVAGVIGVSWLVWRTYGQQVADIDVMARYFLAVPGAMVAGFALHRRAIAAFRGGPAGLRGGLNLAAWSFMIYALTQLIVPRAEFFPANFINTASFLQATGLPVQVIRAGMAILCTIGLIRATQVMEDERQHQYLAVQKSRIEALQQLEDELKEREVMRRELLRHIVQAQEEERARIARELHDETSQVLTAFTFHLAALRNILKEDEKANKQIDQLRNLSRRMSAGIYRLVHDLRPAHLDDLGLIAALKDLREEADNQMGLQVDLEVQGTVHRIDPLVETALYRIAQEALTNIMRHASASEAKMDVAFINDAVILRITDRGVGFLMENLKGQGWGLAGMRERAESIGGTLRIHSEPGMGTEIEITVAKGMRNAASASSLEGVVEHGEN